jgi:YVTN family beta-propeller protein
VVAEIKLGTNPGAILVTPDAIWVSNHRGGSVSRVDPATNKVVATISIGPAKASGPASIRLVRSELWVAVPNISEAVRIDPATNEPVATVKVPGLLGLLVAGDALYAYGIRDQLFEIATDENAVARKFSPEHIPWTFRAGAFWGSEGKDLIRFDGAPFDSFERWQVPGSQKEYGDIALDDRSIWLPTDDGSLIRVELPA